MRQKRATDALRLVVDIPTCSMYYEAMKMLTATAVPKNPHNSLLLCISISTLCCSVKGATLFRGLDAISPCFVVQTIFGFRGA